MTTPITGRSGPVPAAPWFAVAVAVACGSAPDTTSLSTDSATPGPTTATTLTGTTCDFCPPFNWNDDGVIPGDLDGDGVVEAGCGDSLDISINDPLGVTDWDFGMAHPDWTGEDCLNGQGAYAFCHPIGLEHTLTEVCTADEIVAGTTTLLDAAKDPYLTYYLADANDCFVWGDDTYYASLGCTQMM